jgi:Subtilase family
MHRIWLIVILGLALTIEISRGGPNLLVWPTSALRGEIVMVGLQSGNNISKVEFGLNDPNFRPKVVLPSVNCPDYLKVTATFRGTCVQIPSNSWGGPQQLTVGGETVNVNVFGENLPSPSELKQDDKKSFNPLANRGWQPPVPDLRRAFILWFPAGFLEASKKFPLSQALQTPDMKNKGFNPGQYEFTPLTKTPTWLGGFGGGKSICNGYIQVVGFRIPTGSQERLGFVLDQVKAQLVSFGKVKGIDQYVNANGDPVGSPSTPASKPADGASKNPTPKNDVKTNGNTGAGTTIAVLDSGVTPDPSLFGSPSRVISNGAGNFANWTWAGGMVNVPNGSGPTVDDFALNITSPGGTVAKNYGSHGTAVAALAAGNGVGVAPAARILPVKVCQKNGVCTLPGVIQGACYALKNGGDPKKLVLNMSLGGDTPSSILSGILQDATAAGVPVVASVGNEWKRRMERLGQLNHYPADARDKNQKPIEGVIGVGAFGHFPELAPVDFSHEGGYLDVFAPGVKSVVPTPPPFTDEYDGTSFAAPIVAGALALTRETDTTSSAAKLEVQVKATKCTTPPKTKDVFPTSYGDVAVLNLPCIP